MRRPLFTLLPAIVLAVLAGRLLRSHLGLEMSSASIQAWVDHVGWAAPAIYLGLVVFRHFLLIPSTVVIAAGGLCFGATVGAGLGALGIALCGLGQFALVRGLRPRWVLSQVDRNVWGLERIIERAGPWLVAVVTAHPAMPMSPVHLAAGLSPVSIATFAAALSFGALVRAFVLAFFGSTLLEPGSPRFYAASLLLLAVFTVPLLHRGLRRRMLGNNDER